MPKCFPKLAELVYAGATLDAAARKCGISRTHAHRLIQRFGTDARRRTKPRLLPETRARIRRLRKQGLSITRTAAELAVSRDSVRRHGAMDDPNEYRCGGCGGKTTIRPCAVCEARKLQAK